VGCIDSPGGRNELRPYSHFPVFPFLILFFEMYWPWSGYAATLRSFFHSPTMAHALSGAPPRMKFAS